MIPDDDEYDEDELPTGVPIYKELPDGRYVCWDPMAGIYCVVPREFVPPLRPLVPPPRELDHSLDLDDDDDE